ncbi:MBL fold metallo-hydrolase [Bacteriovoracales bacterium]|nr:MBL fold metallo-hydrolase [Bacteriovoracales bacterium]
MKVRFFTEFFVARLSLKREQNKNGPFFVDTSCIECGTCYWMAPNTFKSSEGKSAVYSQPQNSTEEEEALKALFSCPTFSIGSSEKKVESYFPFPFGEPEDLVFLTGYHSEKSFGATSYFIQRKDGNILIDSPRYLKKMATKLEKKGGLRFQYLTHRDDIGDTDSYWKHFQTQRIIHQDDATREDLRKYEIQLKGNDSFSLDDDLEIIPVPGHTKGSSVLLFKNKYLFTGDHLAYSKKLQQLIAFKNHCWYNFEEQIKSMEKLLQLQFEYVLPGHGAPFHSKQMKKELKKCIDWMKA